MVKEFVCDLLWFPQKGEKPKDFSDVRGRSNEIIEKFKQSKQQAVEYKSLIDFLYHQKFVEKVHDFQYHFNYNGEFCTGIVTKFWNKSIYQSYA